MRRKHSQQVMSIANLKPRTVNGRSIVKPNNAMVSRLFLLLAFICLCGCETVSYYGHAASGQMAVLNKRKPLDAIIDDVDNQYQQQDQYALLKSRLILVKEIRHFAQHDLGLPVGKAYSTYANLARPYALWNVFAVEPLSFTSYKWCAPIVGCMTYRGFFSEPRAQAEAAKLKKKQFDVATGGVKAYSTLGYFSDPVLNTFVYDSQAYLINLLLHEIAHRKIYIQHDTQFNESFAVAVAKLGMQAWYDKKGQNEAYRQYLKSQNEALLLFQLLSDTKHRLGRVYGDETLSVSEKMDQKHIILTELKKQYLDLKHERGWNDSRDQWIENVNNASLVNLKTYKGWEPAFIEMFRQSGQNWEIFYQKVEELANAPKDERHRRLDAMLNDQRALF